jgi:hypothetical protein
MSYPSFADISRTFAPGWFAAVMGTGVLALTTHGLAQRWPVAGAAGRGAALVQQRAFRAAGTALADPLAALPGRRRCRPCCTSGTGQFLPDLLDCACWCWRRSG